MSEKMTGKNELRRQAEARMAELGDEHVDGAPEDREALIHELRTHQIELEMQNEELRKTQLELSEASELYSGLYNFSPTGYVTLTPKLMIEQANFTLANMLDLDLVGLLSSPFSRFVCKEDQDIYYRLHRTVVDSGLQQAAELRLNKAGGSEFWARIEIATARADASGRLLLSISDISERKQAEVALIESNEMIRLLLDSTAEAIYTIDLDGNCTLVNKSFLRLLGYDDESEFLGKNMHKIVHHKHTDGSYLPEGQCQIELAMRNGEGIHVDDEVFCRKDGTCFPATYWSYPMFRNNRVVGCVVTFLDITDQLSLEQQLQQAQKMEAIGTLVGGIAHDFNNLLAGITGSLYLVKKETTEMPQTTNRLDGIESQCFRAADMISQLLTFARKDTVHMMPFDLTSFIKESFKLSRVSIAENIHLNNEICSEKLVISGDATQLQQVIMNLLNNARDAVAYAEQATISISLVRYEADERFHKLHPEVVGKHFARLSICDNGKGIAKSNVEHLFEPFFTTKEVGKGTGLGLAMVFGAVQNHLGAIEVESKVNEGSIFHIYLPLHVGEKPMQLKVEQAVDAGEGETILLVDDDPNVLNSTAEVLQSLGYKVLVAENGLQAVKIFEKKSAMIDLLILDVVMPDMGGMEAAKCMRSINPDIPVIFSTGYDFGQVLVDENRLQNAIELSKPTPIAELSKNIRSMLSS